MSLRDPQVVVEEIARPLVRELDADVGIADELVGHEMSGLLPAVRALQLERPRVARRRRARVHA